MKPTHVSVLDTIRTHRVLDEAELRTELKLRKPQHDRLTEVLRDLMKDKWIDKLEAGQNKGRRGCYALKCNILNVYRALASGCTTSDEVVAFLRATSDVSQAQIRTTLDQLVKNGCLSYKAGGAWVSVGSGPDDYVRSVEHYEILREPMLVLRSRSAYEEEVRESYSDRVARLHEGKARKAA